MIDFKRFSFCLMIAMSGMVFMFIPKCALRPYINSSADEEIIEAFRQVQVFDDDEKNNESRHEIEIHVKKE